MKIIKNLTFAALAALAVTLLFPTSTARADDSSPVLLTFEKSIAGGGPIGYQFHFLGSFDGDFIGTLFTGVQVAQTIDKQGKILHLEADYVFTAADGIHSFTAHVEGNQNSHTGKAVLNGVVTAGSLKGAQVQVQFEIVECPTLCFQGTILILPASAD